MNIIPGLHKPLVSVSKLADAGYTTIFNKNQASVYDASTTTIIASKPPMLIRHSASSQVFGQRHYPADKRFAIPSGFNHM